MICKLNRDGEYLVCECCKTKIKTNKDNVKMNCKGGENCQAQEYPSIYQMGLNAIKAGFQHVQNGIAISSDEEQARRLEICKGCDKYDVINNRCFECGCYMAWKSKMESSHCPLDKW